MSARSGTQFEIADGADRAVIASVGATLRRLSLGGREVLRGFPADVIAPYGSGQVLAPWPNRLADGRYRFEGIDGSAALDEPARNNAIHGLVRWLEWGLDRHDGSSVALRATLVPQPAYPWRVVLDITYALAGGALSVTLRATNEDESPAPFGFGFHPYFACGPGGADGAVLRVPATSRLTFDDRALPTGEVPLASDSLAGITSHDGLLLDGVVLDDCLTGLVRDPDGRWRVAITPEAGSPPVVVAADEAFRYVMCFTADTLPPAARRGAVALEPMTCPPNALATGTDLDVIAPGATLEGTFSVALA